MGLVRKLKTENPLFLRGFFAASLLYAIAAYFSSGFYHWDEYFQILEFTAYKWGIKEVKDLPWEYEAGMRPWLQAALIAPFKFLGPHNTVFLARLVMGQAFLYALLNWYLETKDRFRINSSNYFWGTFLIWFFPILLVRYSSEAFSGLFALIFFTQYIKDTKCPVSHAIMGICAALAFWSRFQVGVLLFLPLFHIIFLKRRALPSAALIFAFLIICGINIVIDSWGYEKITFSPYNYFYENIILKKTSQFGENPWWDYLKWILLKPTPLIALPLLGGLFLFLKNHKKNTLGWSILLFFGIHQFISHKELRFLFPLIPFIPFIIFYAFKELRIPKKISTPFVLINAVASLVLFRPLHPIESFSKVVPAGPIEVRGPRSPEVITGKLKARFFYNPKTVFSSKHSNVVFTSSIKEHIKVKSNERCNNTYTSRLFITQKDIQKNRPIWSLWKCTSKEVNQ